MRLTVMMLVVLVGAGSALGAPLLPRPRAAAKPINWATVAPQPPRLTPEDVVERFLRHALQAQMYREMWVGVPEVYYHMEGRRRAYVEAAEQVLKINAVDGKARR